MTPEAQLALINALPTIIAAVAAVIAAVGTVVAGFHTSGKLDKADGKLDHITVLTNSTLTSAMNRIDDLEKTIRELLAANSTDEKIVQKSK